MSAPFEVVASPLTVWVAPLGTDFPDVDEAPDGDWFLLGTSGDKNYSDAGVTVTHNQTITPWTPAGTTYPRKIWRTAEELLVTFELVDISPAQYAKVLNDAEVTTVPASSGVPGTKAFSIYQGLEVNCLALLARGVSPVDEDLAAQYQLFHAYQGGSFPITYNKPGNVAGLQCEWHALYDEDQSGVGDLVIQTAAAS